MFSVLIFMLHYSNKTLYSATPFAFIANLQRTSPPSQPEVGFLKTDTPGLFVFLRDGGLLKVQPRLNLNSWVSNPSASISYVAGTTGAHHCTQLFWFNTFPSPLLLILQQLRFVLSIFPRKWDSHLFEMNPLYSLLFYMIFA